MEEYSQWELGWKKYPVLSLLEAISLCRGPRQKWGTCFLLQDIYIARRLYYVRWSFLNIPFLVLEMCSVYSYLSRLSCLTTWESFSSRSSYPLRLNILPTTKNAAFCSALGVVVPMTPVAYSFCSSSLDRDLACLISLPTPLKCRWWKCASIALCRVRNWLSFLSKKLGQSELYSFIWRSRQHISW